jgi:hypothetical protein
MRLTAAADLLADAIDNLVRGTALSPVVPGMRRLVVIRELLPIR